MSNNNTHHNFGVFIGERVFQKERLRNIIKGSFDMPKMTNEILNQVQDDT
jgi:hypothetical protein